MPIEESNPAPRTPQITAPAQALLNIIDHLSRNGNTSSKTRATITATTTIRAWRWSRKHQITQLEKARDGGDQADKFGLKRSKRGHLSERLSNLFPALS